MKNILWIIAIISIISCKSEDEQINEDINPCGIELVDANDYNCSFNVNVGSFESHVTDSIGQVYLALWKTILLEKTSMTETYFEEHFSDVVVYGSIWNTGITIRVSYVYTLDWVQFRHTDKFLVWLNSTTSAYQHLDIPRDQFLEKDKIELILDKTVANSSIAYVKSIETLAFSNCEETINSVRDQTGYKGLMPNRLTFLVAGKQPRIDGYPYMITFGQENIDDNLCVLSYVNLFTGKAIGSETVCCIIG